MRNEEQRIGSLKVALFVHDEGFGHRVAASERCGRQKGNPSRIRGVVEGKMVGNELTIVASGEKPAGDPTVGPSVFIA